MTSILDFTSYLNPLKQTDQMSENEKIDQEGILDPIKLKEKIGYGLGDLGFNFYWANISAFLLIFYTDVFGISAAAAGTMMLVTKIVDAFTDPIMGAIADRTKHVLVNLDPTYYGVDFPWPLQG